MRYTLWTIPQSEWTPILPDVVITPELKKELAELVRSYNDTALKERLKMFNNKINYETWLSPVGSK